MRVDFSFGSMLVAALAASSCGGNATPPAAPVPGDAATAEAPLVGATSDKTAGGDDEAWAGEQTGKSPERPAADAPPPEPTKADPQSPETRTMEVIRQRVLENRKAARKCYEDARRDLKDLKGDVVIHFVLDPDGKVRSAELNQERSTLKAPAVSDCVIAVIRAIHFPKSSRGMETSTNYPFNFTP